MPPGAVKPGTNGAQQYEHIKDGQKEQSASESRAKELAAHTVNGSGRGSATNRQKGRTRDQL
jgi:hypothetical protein